MFILNKYLAYLFPIAFLLFLVACGDDDSSSELTVISVTPDIEFKFSLECDALEKDDSSSVVVCGNDSVVFLNAVDCSIGVLSADSLVVECGESQFKIYADKLAKPESSQVEEKYSSQMEILDSTQISSSSVELIQDVSSSDMNDSAIVDSSDIEVSNVEISGVSQKGPFVVGSVVTAYELLNGRTLKQTGKSFSGYIQSDDGRFNIKSVKLSSQYAYIVADGYYRNEVTGVESRTPIRLRALTNLKGRKSANINLLTHLEYDRVVNLVVKDGLSVGAAKDSAEREVFRTFYIDSENFNGKSEDLDIFGDSEANAALLAVSVMLQRNLSESELTNILINISYDLADDGIWHDPAARAKIADWAFDYRDSCDKITKNVSAWKLGKVPKFEKYVKNFWETEYDLEPCSGKNNGVIVEIKNEKSKYYVNGFGDESKLRLICRDGSRWDVASDLEKDTYEYGSAPVGEFRYGRVNSDSVYIYALTADFESAEWRLANDFERDTFKLTSLVAENELVVDGLIVPCAYTDNYCVMDSLNGGWRYALESELDIWTACTKNKEGMVIWNNGYRACINAQWIEATENDYNFGLCYEKNAGMVVPKDSVETVFYEDQRVSVDHYYHALTCDPISLKWRLSLDEEYNMDGFSCDKVGTILRGSMVDSILYKCDENGVFERLYSQDTLAINPENPEEPFVCIPSRYGEYAKLKGYESYFKCQERNVHKLNGACSVNGIFFDCDPSIPVGPHSEWTPTYEKRSEGEDCVDLPSGEKYCFKTIAVGHFVWMAENLNYVPEDSSYQKGLTTCGDEDPDCSQGRLYSWTAAVNMSQEYENERSGITGDGFYQGVCPNGYRILCRYDLDYLRNIYDDLYPNLLYGASGGGQDVLGLDLVGEYWVSDEQGLDAGINILVSNRNINVYADVKTKRFHVRCIKNENGENRWGI